MNTKQIDAAIELAKTLNFNRAADKLCISQPTLSYEIKELENEIGFKIFDRSGKGAVLTPAGHQFCATLKNIRNELKNAIEQGQNLSSEYSDSIIIGIPVRSMLKYLPQAIIKFNEKYANIQIVPKFIDFYNTHEFLQKKIDILIAMDFEVKNISDIKVYPLYECGISLLTRNDDKLSMKKIIHHEDLYGQTLMIGGGSPPALQRVQKRLIQSQKICYFNSATHDTTLTNIEAQKGVCLSPDFFDEDKNKFARIPFACPEKFKIVLSCHTNDKRESLFYFIDILRNLYK